jgi:hypothetical protein
MTSQSGASPPENERTPGVASEGSSKKTGCGKSLGVKVAPDADIPPSRPWARRADAHAVELLFCRDREAWRRRVDAARRLAHDGRDEFVAPSGCWNPIEEIGVEE